MRSVEHVVVDTVESKIHEQVTTRLRSSPFLKNKFIFDPLLATLSKEFIAGDAKTFGTALTQLSDALKFEARLDQVPVAELPAKEAIVHAELSLILRHLKVPQKQLTLLQYAAEQGFYGATSNPEGVSRENLEQLTSILRYDITSAEDRHDPLSTACLAGQEEMAIYFANKYREAIKHLKVADPHTAPIEQIAILTKRLSTAIQDMAALAPHEEVQDKLSGEKRDSLQDGSYNSKKGYQMSHVAWGALIGFVLTALVEAIVYASGASEGLNDFLDEIWHHGHDSDPTAGDETMSGGKKAGLFFSGAGIGSALGAGAGLLYSTEQRRP